MELMDKDRLRIAQAAAAKITVPEGPMMDQYDPLRLAEFIESEASRATVLMLANGRKPGETQFAKVTVTMDVVDALKLVRDLRKLKGRK